MDLKSQGNIREFEINDFGDLRKFTSSVQREKMYFLERDNLGTSPSSLVLL